MWFSRSAGDWRWPSCEPWRKASASTTARTIGATGNLTFESDEASIAELEKNLEAAFNARFGKHVAIIVRNADAWRRLLRANPFRDEATADPARVAVRVMRIQSRKAARTP